MSRPRFKFGEVRAGREHLRDLRVRVLRMGPVSVGPLLGPLAVQAGQFGARRRGDAGRRGQSVQKRLVALARVPADDAPQRRIRFQRRRVDARRTGPRQPCAGQPPQNPREDRLVRLDVDPPACARHHRMVWWGLLQRDVLDTIFESVSPCMSLAVLQGTAFRTYAYEARAGASGSMRVVRAPAAVSMPPTRDGLTWSLLRTFFRLFRKTQAFSLRSFPWLAGSLLRFSRGILRCCRRGAV